MSWKSLAPNSERYTYEYFFSEFICRICWGPDGVKEITAKMSEDDANCSTFAETIFECVGVDLTTNSNPRKICESCWDEVVNFNEFKKFCLQTERLLQEILQRNTARLKHETTEIANEEELSSNCDYTNLEFEKSDHSDTEIKATKIKKKRKKVEKKSESFCTACKINLTSTDEFRKHNFEIHGVENGKFKCLGCQKVFGNRKTCLRHEMDFCTALKNGYKCKFCERFLPKRRIYEKHLRAHREDVPIELPDEMFKCKKCREIFISMDLLNEHMNNHEEDKKNWICDVCGRVFTRHDYLQKHKLIHDGIKKHACPYCNFRARQKSSLTVHIRKHTGERPYRCDVCPQRCVSSSNLLQHRERHLGIKKYPCNLCDKAFGYKISLEEHMSTVHERSEVHPCGECGATFTRMRGLRRHLLEKHGKRLAATDLPECKPNDLRDKAQLSKDNSLMKETDFFTDS